MKIIKCTRCGSKHPETNIQKPIPFICDRCTGGKTTEGTSRFCIKCGVLFYTENESMLCKECSKKYIVC